MARVAQDWLVLVDLTRHSASALNRHQPAVLALPVARAVGGRGRRPFPQASPADGHPDRARAGFTGHRAYLVVFGWAQLGSGSVLALLQGIATAFDNPARQAFVSEMVPTARLANAVALNSASFNAGRPIGPAAAGLVIAAWGTGVGLLINQRDLWCGPRTLAALDPAALTPHPSPGEGIDPGGAGLCAGTAGSEAGHGAGVFVRPAPSG